MGLKPWVIEQESSETKGSARVTSPTGVSETEVLVGVKGNIRCSRGRGSKRGQKAGDF